jgi:hypothetical protein
MFSLFRSSTAVVHLTVNQRVTGSIPVSGATYFISITTMTVDQLIQFLQRQDPTKDVLVESETGDPWPCFGAKNDVWVEDDGTETPVIVIQIDN